VAEICAGCRATVPRTALTGRAAIRMGRRASIHELRKPRQSVAAHHRRRTRGDDRTHRRRSQLNNQHEVDVVIVATPRPGRDHRDVCRALGVTIAVVAATRRVARTHSTAAARRAPGRAMVRVHIARRNRHDARVLVTRRRRRRVRHFGDSPAATTKRTVTPGLVAPGLQRRSDWVVCLGE
jgi:hypothetical protein